MTQSKTVLLVDDETRFLFSLSVMMKRAGYQVLTANNSKDGLQLAVTHRPDIILADVNMPRQNGFQLKTKLYKEPSTRGIPFIFLTARNTIAQKIDGLELGADDYITKPFNNSEMLARLKAVLRRVEFERNRVLAEVEKKMEPLRKQILSTLSHELRTPVSLIQQTLELSLMERFKNNPQQQQEFIQQALNNTYRLQLISESMITLSEIDQGMVNDFRQSLDIKFDFYPVLERCRQYWENKQLTIEVVAEPQVTIHAPRKGFKQAVAHLLDNGCKFSPQNGFVKIFLTKNGRGGCILTVINQGSSIPRELREKVFERFYQASQGDNRQDQGLGVGLTIARAFARGLGGDVTILDSKKDCWTRMVIPPAKADWMTSHLYQSTKKNR